MISLNIFISYFYYNLSQMDLMSVRQKHNKYLCLITLKKTLQLRGFGICA